MDGGPTLGPCETLSPELQNIAARGCESHIQDHRSVVWKLEEASKSNGACYEEMSSPTDGRRSKKRAVNGDECEEMRRMLSAASI